MIIGTHSKVNVILTEVTSTKSSRVEASRRFVYCYFVCRIVKKIEHGWKSIVHDGVSCLVTIFKQLILTVTISAA